MENYIINNEEVWQILGVVVFMTTMQDFYKAVQNFIKDVKFKELKYEKVWILGKVDGVERKTIVFANRVGNAIFTINKKNA